MLNVFGRKVAVSCFCFFFLLINTVFNKHYLCWTHRKWNKGVILQKSQEDSLRKEKNDIF